MCVSSSNGSGGGRGSGQGGEGGSDGLAGSQAKPHQKLLIPHVHISDEYLITRTKKTAKDWKGGKDWNVQRVNPHLGSCVGLERKIEEGLENFQGNMIKGSFLLLIPGISDAF